MPRYVLLSDGSDDVGRALDALRSLAGAEVLDQTDSRALLIEASEGALEEVRQSLPGWRVLPETLQARPQPPFPRGAWKLDEG